MLLFALILTRGFSPPPLLHAEMNGCLLFYLMALILVCLCEIAIAAVLVSLLADINVNHSGLGQY